MKVSAHDFEPIDFGPIGQDMVKMRFAQSKAESGSAGRGNIHVSTFHVMTMVEKSILTNG